MLCPRFQKGRFLPAGLGVGCRQQLRDRGTDLALNTDRPMLTESAFPVYSLVAWCPADHDISQSTTKAVMPAASSSFRPKDSAITPSCKGRPESDWVQPQSNQR